MPDPHPRILLTGFGPFPGVPVNATAVLVPRLAEAAAGAFPGSVIQTVILPTEWAGAAGLAALYGKPGPRLALHFGVWPGCVGFAIETVARNLAGPRLDAAGELPPAGVLKNGGPARRTCRLPVATLLERLAAAGIPAIRSNDAGDYLCNAILYHGLAHARRSGTTMGFIHIPASLVGAGADGLAPVDDCPLDWAQAVAGGLAIIGACLDA